VATRVSSVVCVEFLLTRSVIHPVLNLFLSKSRQQSTTNLNECRCLSVPSLPLFEPFPFRTPLKPSDDALSVHLHWFLVNLPSVMLPPLVMAKSLTSSLLDHKTAVELSSLRVQIRARRGRRWRNRHDKVHCGKTLTWRQKRVQTLLFPSFLQHNR